MRRAPIAVATLLLSLAWSGCFHNAEPAPAEIISSVTYRSLHLEIDYASSARPRDGAVNLLKQRIAERLDKPDGVTVGMNVITPGGDGKYTDDELRELEKKHRNDRHSGTRAVIYILYLDGGHAEDTENGKVLGVQFGASAIAMFKKSIDSSGQIFPGFDFGAENVEKSVLVHEFGHVIGLVNNGLPMVRPHEDTSRPEGRGHSSNEDSVMYWAIENTLGFNSLTGQLPNDFDADDRADIHAAGGRP